MAEKRKSLKPSSDALFRIKRGLSGYVSYLAACEMNESFSEYILYEPTLRILTTRGFTVQCEHPCPGFQKKGRGDVKKLDFVATANGITFAIEMKWAQKKNLNIEADVEKLKFFQTANPSSQGFICVFGKKSILENICLVPAGLREQGNAVYTEFGVTKYGCRTYEVTND